jgi:hypothetical protein
MSIRSLTTPTFTPGAGVADTVALTDNLHLSLQGLTATERLVIQEVYIGGLAPSASSPMIMLLSRHSTFGLTPTLGTNGKDAATDGSSATGTANGYMSAATDPQRSATLGLLNCALNAFGGNFKWFPSNIPGKDISIVGNTASLGEAGISSFTGSTAGAPLGAHIIYEKIVLAALMLLSLGAAGI